MIDINILPYYNLDKILFSELNLVLLVLTLMEAMIEQHQPAKISNN